VISTFNAERDADVGSLFTLLFVVCSHHHQNIYWSHCKKGQQDDSIQTDHLTKELMG